MGLGFPIPGSCLQILYSYFLYILQYSIDPSKFSSFNSPSSCWLAIHNSVKNATRSDWRKFCQVRMTCEPWNGKDMEGTGRGVMKILSRNVSVVTDENHENCQDTQNQIRKHQTKSLWYSARSFRHRFRFRCIFHSLYKVLCQSVLKCWKLTGKYSSNWILGTNFCCFLYFSGTTSTMELS